MKIVGFIVVIIIVVAFVFSCKNDTKPKKLDSIDLTYSTNSLLEKFIKPPFFNNQIEQEKFTINTGKDEEIHTENGSVITIYKNSIVNELGEKVNGQIEIEYRDFHNPLEIFLSGIPMEYDSDGEKQIFETAGMFEIKAYQDGQSLKLKEGAEIDVRLKSTSNEKRFKFYRFDESTGKWEDENKEMKITVYPKTDELRTAQNKVKITTVIAPVEHNEKRFAFNIEVNKEQYPELTAYEGTIFEVKDENSFKSLYYNVQWDKAQIEKVNNKHYKLELFKEDTSIVVDVKPVIERNKFKKAIKKYQSDLELLEESKTEISDFDIYKTQSIAYNSEMSPRVEITRQFRINGFGIYNCDDPSIIRPETIIKDLIVLKNGAENRISENQYYVVDLQRNALITIYGKPRYYKNKETLLWAIINNSELVIVHPSQFKTIPDNKVLRVNSYPIQEGLDLISDLLVSH